MAVASVDSLVPTDLTPSVPKAKTATTTTTQTATPPHDPLAFTPGATTGPNTPAPTASAGLGPVVAPVDPANDLRNQQITPGSLLDRFQLAQQQFGTYADATNPAFQASLRDANRAAAATGRLGSGMLRTSFGDLANQRTQALQNERDSLFQNALLGSVQDAQNNFSNYLAEQNYQTGAQNQAFNQGIAGANLQDQ